MPDSAGTFYGDRANVLPDNTAAFLHLTDQFNQINQQNLDRKERERRYEAERGIRLQDHVGDAFKGIRGATLAQAAIDKMIPEEIAKVNQARSLNKKMTDSDMFQLAYESAAKIKSLADKTKAIEASVAKGVQDLTASDPTVDAGAFADLALHDALFTTNPDGTKRLKDDADINPLPSDEYVSYALRTHKDKILRPGYATLQKALKDDKTQEETINDVYDPKTGDRLVAGGSGKVPYYAEKVIDAKGNYLGNKLKTVPYKVEGKEILDEKGKPIEVLPDEFYTALTRKPSSITAQMEMQFEKNYPNVDPESPQGDLLKRKIMTDLVNTHADWVYKPNKDESADRKYKIEKDRREEARLRLAEQANRRQEEKLNIALTGKDNTEIRDAYSKMIQRENEAPGTFHRLDVMDVNTQTILKNYAQNLAAGKDSDGKDEKLVNKDLFYKLEDDGQFHLYRGDFGADGKALNPNHIGALPPEDVLLGKGNNTTKPERKSAIQKAKEYGKKVIEKITGKKEKAPDPNNPLGL